MTPETPALDPLLRGIFPGYDFAKAWDANQLTVYLSKYTLRAKVAPDGSINFELLNHVPIHEAERAKSPLVALREDSLETGDPNEILGWLSYTRHLVTRSLVEKMIPAIRPERFLFAADVQSNSPPIHNLGVLIGVFHMSKDEILDVLCERASEMFMPLWQETRLGSCRWAIPIDCADPVVARKYGLAIGASDAPNIWKGRMLVHGTAPALLSHRLNMLIDHKFHVLGTMEHALTHGLRVYLEQALALLARLLNAYNDAGMLKLNIRTAPAQSE